MKPQADEEASELSVSDARRIALGLLARREHSRFELNRKMKQRGCEPEMLASLLDDFEQRGWLSDNRYSESYVLYRVRKGYGPSRISQELSERGISSELAQIALNEIDVDWCELARNMRQKRFGSEIPSDFKAKAKQQRFLGSRGFSSDHIKSAFRVTDVDGAE